MKRQYFNICKACGAHLDPGERCDCEEIKMTRCQGKDWPDITAPVKVPGSAGIPVACRKGYVL